MQLLFFLCLLTFTTALQCTANLPNTCECKCYNCGYRNGYVNVRCTTVPNLYELLTTLENGTFYNVEVYKCENPVLNLVRLPAFSTFKLLINHCGLESVADDAFTDISDMVILDLSSNALTTVPPFPYSPLLESIWLTDNMIRSFGKASIKGSSSNDSADLSRGSFKNVPYMTDIHLQNNLLTEITNATFANMEELRIIDLSNNKLNRIAADAFQNLLPLINLNLSFNELTYLEPETFHNVDAYPNLYLNNNRLTHLSANSFVGNKRLDVLHLQNNHLAYISPGTFNGLVDLYKIDLSNNNFTNIDDVFIELPKLRLVNLSNNSLTDIRNTTFEHFWKLHLDLSNNQIRSVAPNAFVNAYILHLDNNQLDSIDGIFSEHNCLIHLNLHNNLFTEITNTTFNVLTQLVFLNFSNNHIHYIAPYSFYSTTLVSLDISNNNLTTLEPYSIAIKERPLQTVKYGGNPFVCDDKLEWFRKYLKYEVRNGRWWDDNYIVEPVICPVLEKKKNINCNCDCSNT
uniref:LRRNT domain-containing protein n=1 Tax=Panagrellus redivivus TaxID=6233 RepID=A0A7E4WCA4_PANRE